MKYEKSMIRLDQIISDLSSGNIFLEDSLALFSEGVKLIDECKNQLNSAKLKIVELTDLKDED